MIKHKHIAISIAIVGLVFGLSVAPALAKDGNDDGRDETETTQTEKTEKPESHESSESHESEEEHDVKEDAKPEIEHEVETESRDEGEQSLTELRKKHKEHTQEERQKNCSTAKNGLEAKLQSLKKNATKHQTRITSVYEKALAYQKEQNIEVANLDELVAKANAAQTQAASSVSVLNGLGTTIDCNQATVASTVATFKASASQARTDLKAYKSAVKELLTALENARDQEAN